jgi:hypothetical protein
MIQSLLTNILRKELSNASNIFVADTVITEQLLKRNLAEGGIRGNPESSIMVYP